MKRFVLILLGLWLFGGVAYAQYDERERLANDPRSAGAGAYHAKRSLMSLGSNDRSSWTVPAQQRDGSWTQRYVSSNDNITIRVPQRRVSRTAQQKVNRKAQRDAEHSAWLEQRNAQLEAAKEAQREQDRIRQGRLPRMRPIAKWVMRATWPPRRVIIGRNRCVIGRWPSRHGDWMSNIRPVV